MAQALADVLADRFDEPPEVRIIKSFVRQTYQQPVEVKIQPNQIIIMVKSSALAGTLRPQLHELKQLCNTDKRIMLRIVG